MEIHKHLLVIEIVNERKHLTRSTPPHSKADVGKL